MKQPSPLRDYAVVTLCYWAFTLSDGALRMLVLLHLHELGRTPLALALVLLPYEAAGVVTNLLSGWLGARHGLKLTLVCGLVLQIVACLLLSADPTWLSVPYVMATQVLSGIAKDLAKTGAKSYVRQLAPRASVGGLFRLVALLTGSKNAMKGLGFFVGGALLASAGFRLTNVALAALLAVLLLLALLRLPPAATKQPTPFAALLSHSAAVNWLAAARMFLFGSRDVWFAVALPLFLVTAVGWSATAVGAFLSAWVIAYGVIQGAAPRLVKPADVSAGSRATARWTMALLAPLVGTTFALATGLPTEWVVVSGLCLYGAVFAVTSSLHSWLIVGIAGDEGVAERVGFYYAANALGRLVGTLLSGLLFGLFAEGIGGLSACLVGAGTAVVLAALAVLPIGHLAKTPPTPAEP